MREIKLILGEKEFTVRELPDRKNKEWRKQLEPILDGVSKLLREDNTEINSAGDLVDIMARNGRALIAQSENAADIVISYSPLLQAEREWLDENVTETEYLAALMALARVAYPTDFFIQQVAGSKSLGLLRPQTSTNSA